MNGSVVMAKIAGIESSAKTTSVVSMTISTINKRRCHQDAVHARKEFLVVKFFTDRHNAPENFDDRILFGMNARFALRRQLVRGKDQERAKDVNNPVELFDQRRADKDQASRAKSARRECRERVRDAGIFAGPESRQR